MKRRRLSCAALVMLAATILPPAARAAYPDHQIKLVIPYTPGGPADILGRFIAQKMTLALGKPVIVENKPGAGLAVGADYVASSRPDGYTLLEGAASMLIASSPSRTPEQNLHDFVPISLFCAFPEVVVVNRDLPVHNVQELIAYARANPGKLDYGSSGIGSLTHMAGALFVQMAGIDMLHVPYRGINEALTDVMAGRMQAAFPGAPIGLPLDKNGQVRALAVTGAQRTASAPNLPTVAEAGLAGYDVTPWNGVLAPAGTPQAVIALWHDEMVRIMQTDEVKQRWLALGADPIFSKTPQDFETLMRNDVVKWAKLVKDADIKLQ